MSRIFSLIFWEWCLCFPFSPHPKGKQHINIFDPPPFPRTIPKSCSCMFIGFFCPPKLFFFPNLWFATGWPSQKHENDENEEDIEATQTATNKRVERWISGTQRNDGNEDNHGNLGCKQYASQTMGLEKPEDQSPPDRGQPRKMRFSKFPGSGLKKI